LSADSVRELKSKVTEWDKNIGDLFQTHRQHFTYAPVVTG